MLEGKALDQFMDRFFGDSCAQSLPGEEESGQELEEYELKEDGIIIQPIHKGKIEKRTWIGLIMFLAFVPLVLFILVHKFHGKHDVVISLLILAYATIARGGLCAPWPSRRRPRSPRPTRPSRRPRSGAWCGPCVRVPCAAP